MNEIGHRPDVAKIGTAFGSVRDIASGYDSLGQVIKADSTITGLDRAYQCDQMDNRLKSTEGTTDLNDPGATLHTPTALNLYTTIDSLSPSHDADTNMTSGPLPVDPGANSTLAWTAENSLKSTTVNTVTTTYRCDAQSRRIAETTGSETTVYISDGWNPIAEYSTPDLQTFDLERSYTWGMDISGKMQGAGGLDGLLMVTEQPAGAENDYFPAYDGNGNLSEY